MSKYILESYILMSTKNIIEIELTNFVIHWISMGTVKYYI